MDDNTADVLMVAIVCASLVAILVIAAYVISK